MSDCQFTKAHHLLAYILSKSKEPGNIELMKLVYLVDVEYYRLFGKLLSDFRYVRQRLGPWSSKFPEMNSELENNGIIKTISKLSRGGSPILKEAHKFINSKFQPELLPEEKEVADGVLKKFANLPPKKIEQESYRTEPMQEILKDEEKLGKKLIGMLLNFSSIRRDEFMKNWLNNRRKFSERKPDLEYEEFLLKEKQGFTALMHD